MRVAALAVTLVAVASAKACGAVSPPKVDDALLEGFSSRLREIVAETASTGDAPRFLYRKAHQIARVASVADDGSMKISLGGVTLTGSWQKLSLQERRDLARSVNREGDVERTQLLAFFIMATTYDMPEVTRLLRSIPANDGKVVLDMFKTMARESQAPATPAPSMQLTGCVIPETEPDVEPPAQDPPPPNQFLLFDTVAVHTEDAQMMTVPGFGHKPTWWRHQHIPQNWREPVDFAGGTFRIVYNILEKPNRRRFHNCTCISAFYKKKKNHDLASHPGANWTHEPYVDIEEGPVSKNFKGGYQKTARWKNWKWATNPYDRVWMDSYRMGSSQYGPSSVFPIKVRNKMWLVARGYEWHEFGNLGEMDFRNLRRFTDGARLIAHGMLGEAYDLARKVVGERNKHRAAEARWVIRGLTAHVETRIEEVNEYWKEEPDMAVEDLRPLCKHYRGSPLGRRLEMELARLDAHPTTARARRAREIWRKVLEASNRIVLEEYIGTESWNVFMELTPKYKKRYAAELAFMEAGVDEMLSIYSGRNWRRMALALLKNWGLRKRKSDKAVEPNPRAQKRKVYP